MHCAVQPKKMTFNNVVKAHSFVLAQIEIIQRGKSQP